MRFRGPDTEVNFPTHAGQPRATKNARAAPKGSPVLHRQSKYAGVRWASRATADTVRPWVAKLKKDGVSHYLARRQKTLLTLLLPRNTPADFRNAATQLERHSYTAWI